MRREVTVFIRDPAEARLSELVESYGAAVAEIKLEQQIHGYIPHRILIVGDNGLWWAALRRAPGDVDDLPLYASAYIRPEPPDISSRTGGLDLMRMLLRTQFALLFFFMSTSALAGINEGFVAWDRGDFQVALKELRPLAETGDAFAQFMLGSMYHNGSGVTADAVEAVKWFRMAAELGNVNAQVTLGTMYLSGQDVMQDDATAARWYRQAAEQGDAEAQFNLGNVYSLGRGVTQDYGEAVNWFRRAAVQGHSGAQYIMGVMYNNGEGVLQDHAMAVKWYRMAAGQGDVDAQYNLGIMYFNGQGVSQDYVEAYKLFNLAASAGDAEAAKSRDIAESRMSPAQIAEAQKLAREWRPK